MNVILDTCVLCHMSKKIILYDDTSKRMEKCLHLGENHAFRFVCVRFADIVESVIFDLANTLTCDAVCLADRIEGHLLGILSEAVSRYENITGTIRKHGEKTLCGLLWLELNR